MAIVEAVLQAMTLSDGENRANQFAEEVHESVAQRLFLPGSVGKGRVVGHVDIAPVRQKDARLLDDRKAADAGIEEKDRSVSRAHRSRFPSPSGAPSPRGRLRVNLSSELMTPRRTRISGS